MNERNRTLPPPDRADAIDAVVTYSRIGSRIVGEAEAAAADERVAPIFDAVEVPPVRTRDRDAGDLGGQTMEDRPAAHAGGGRSLRFVLLAGVAAIAVGIGVLGLAYNSARTVPNADRAGSAAPAKVAAVSNEAPLDLTPATETPGEGEAAAGLKPSSLPSDPVAASPEAERAPVSASTTEPKLAAVSPDDGETTLRSAVVEPVAAPPLPRSRPKIEAPAAARQSAKPDSQAGTARPDDKDFVENVEKTLANAPRSEVSGEDRAAAPTDPLPLPGPEVATIFPDEEEAPADTRPRHLVPPADIPDVRADDQAYDDTGDGDYYDPSVTGSEYGEPAEPTYGAGDWEPRPEASVAPQWVVLGVRKGRAIVDGREYGVFMVGPGSEIPGAGTVQSIEWRGNGWVVTTSSGAVLTSLADAGRF